MCKLCMPVVLLNLGKTLELFVHWFFKHFWISPPSFYEQTKARTFSLLFLQINVFHYNFFYRTSAFSTLSFINKQTFSPLFLFIQFHFQNVCRFIKFFHWARAFPLTIYFAPSCCRVTLRLFSISFASAVVLLLVFQVPNLFCFAFGPFRNIFEGDF